MSPATTTSRRRLTATRQPLTIAFALTPEVVLGDDSGAAFAAVTIVATAIVDYSGEDCVEGNECWQGTLTFFGLVIGIIGFVVVTLVGVVVAAAARRAGRPRR